MPGSPAAARIGTAGWSIPASQRVHFGEGDSVLARYATRFSAVEINSSFYRPHQQSTYARWAASVPAGFRFSVKLPRTISHELRLLGCSDVLDRFLHEVSGLGGTLGVLLLQLPPSLAFDQRQAGTFLRVLRRRHAGPVACEPRHASWFTASAEELLVTHHVARVAADPPVIAGGDQPAGAPSLRYWRLHGAPRMYYSAYGAQRIHAIAELMQARGGDAWCIFDNTASGAATQDALALRARMQPDA